MDTFMTTSTELSSTPIRSLLLAFILLPSTSETQLERTSKDILLIMLLTLLLKLVIQLETLSISPTSSKDILISQSPPENLDLSSQNSLPSTDLMLLFSSPDLLLRSASRTSMPMDSHLLGLSHSPLELVLMPLLRLSWMPLTSLPTSMPSLDPSSERSLCRLSEVSQTSRPLLELMPLSSRPSSRTS